jgi:hypothetical protein
MATKQLKESSIARARSTYRSFDEYFPIFKILLDYLKSAVKGAILEEVKDLVSKEKRDVEIVIFDGFDDRTGNC